MEAILIREEVNIPVGNIQLKGNLIVPENAIGLVLFSHGSGSSRFSPRNNFVAEQLQKRNMGTLLFDLLTREEDAIYENRFNIELLTERLLAVTRWTKQQPKTKNLSIGYFGASTGAASALKAAAALGKKIAAVVSRGGRPDLAKPDLGNVKAATLLIVGGNDTEVITLNEGAYAEIDAVKALKIIPHSGHLFEEPGKLEEVSVVAAEWLEKNFL